jgi:hypothetical protein
LLLSREHLFPHGREPEQREDPALESRWEELLLEHMASTPLAKGENGWKYKQRLVDCFPFPAFWARQPETLKLSINGHYGLLSLNEVVRLPLITTVIHPNSPFYGYTREKPDANPFPPTWEQNNAGISDDDFYRLSSVHRQAIFSNRYVSHTRWLSSGHLAVDWKLGDLEPPLMGETSVGTTALEDESVVSFRLHLTSSHEQYILLNTKNDFARWILGVNDACRQGLPGPGIEQVKVLNDLLKWVTWFQTVSDKFDPLRDFVTRWSEIPGLPPGLCPPPIRLSRRMFMLSGER